MHFDPRTQAALREAGVEQSTIETASEAVVEAVAADAEAVESFFGTADEPDAGGTFYSDMDAAHSASDVQEHAVDHVDVYTHADDLRGYLRFDSWGVPIEDARVLVEGDGGGADGASTDAGSAPEVVELSLGPTVDGRVKFARTRDAL
jgi:hypothetical protein